MSWFVTPETVRLSLSGGNWIEVKKQLNVREERRILARQMKPTTIGEKPVLDPEQVGVAQVLEYVVNWGGPDLAVKFSESALDNLLPGPFGEIFKAVQDHTEKMEQEADAKNSTGETASSAISPSAA